MAQKNIVASIDVGSDYIKATATEMLDNQLLILGSTFQESEGFENNVITNKNSFKDSVHSVLDGLENILGVSISKVVLGLSIEKPVVEIAAESTPITSNNNIVTGQDIKRVMYRFRSLAKEGYEIVNIIPVKMYVDGNLVENPKGRHGKELTMKAMIISVEKSVLYPILNAFEETKYKLLDVCLLQVADGFEVLKDETLSNQCLINVGYKNSKVTLFNNEVIKAFGNINFGYRSLYNTVMQKYMVEKNTAYKIIESIGCLNNESKLSNEFILVKNINDEKIKIEHSDLNYILKDIASEIFIKIKKDLENVHGNDYVVVFSGGLVELNGFKSLVDEIFGKNGKIYEPKYIGARNSVYSVCLGLARYINYLQTLTDFHYSSLTIDEQSFLSESKKKWKNIDENTVLGKIFGLFFD